MAAPEGSRTTSVEPAIGAAFCAWVITVSSHSTDALLPGACNAGAMASRSLRRLLTQAANVEYFNPVNLANFWPDNLLCSNSSNNSLRRCAETRTRPLRSVGRISEEDSGLVIADMLRQPLKPTRGAGCSAYEIVTA